MTSTNGPSASSTGASRPAAPTSVRTAGVIVAIEGVIAVAWGVVELVRGITGAAESARGAYGMAFWFIPLGAAVLAGGIALLRGLRWGRTLGVLTNVLLGFTGISGAFAQGRPEVGLPLILLAVVVLVLLFSPQTVAWLDGEYSKD